MKQTTNFRAVRPASLTRRLDLDKVATQALDGARRYNRPVLFIAHAPGVPKQNGGEHKETECCIAVAFPTGEVWLEVSIVNAARPSQDAIWKACTSRDMVCPLDKRQPTAKRAEALRETYAYFGAQLRVAGRKTTLALAVAEYHRQEKGGSEFELANNC